MSKTKRCTRCRKELPLSSFYRDAYRYDGLQATCGDCKREVAQAYRADPEVHARLLAKRRVRRAARAAAHRARWALEDAATAAEAGEES